MVELQVIAGAVLLLVAVFTAVHVMPGRNRDTILRRNLIVAALVSSASVGVWGLVLESLIPGAPRTTTPFSDMIISYFAFTILSNLAGMVLLTRVLLTRERWSGLLRRGLLLPVGALYGEVVMVATVLLWAAPFVVVFRSGLLLAYVRALISGFPLVAGLAGITGVAILVLLEPRSRQGIL